jgi:hypothetical protein
MPALSFGRTRVGPDDPFVTEDSSMSTATPTPDDDPDDMEREADRQADAMKAQLRKDVHSWSKARSEASPGRIAESVPVTRKASSQQAATTKKPSAPRQTAKSAGTRSKPFSMSYDGKSTEEYIQYMIDRGAR